MCQISLKSHQWFWREDLYDFSECRYLAIIIFSIAWIRQVWSKFAQCSWRNSPSSFITIALISPWKRRWTFIQTNINALYKWMLCVKFGWNWRSGSLEEEDIWKSSIYFPMSLLSLLGQKHPFQFNKFALPYLKDIFA